MAERVELPNTSDIRILLSAMSFHIAMGAVIDQKEVNVLEATEGQWSSKEVARRVELFEEALKGLTSAYANSAGRNMTEWAAD